MRNICLLLLITALAAIMALFHLEISPVQIASIQHEPYIGEPGKPVFLILEEVHSSLKVQENIHQTIKLLRGLGVKVIALEGTPPSPDGQPLDLSKIRVGDVITRMAVARAWFRLGWLSGGEMEALEDPSLKLFGVENPDKYAAHKAKLDQEREACDALIEEMDSLWRNFSVEDWDQLLPALEQLDQAKAAFGEPVKGAIPLKEAVEIIRRELGKGRSWREAAVTLRERFLKARPEIPNVATLEEAYTTAKDALWEAIIDKAEEKGIDVTSTRELLGRCRSKREEARWIMDGRDEAMISNTLRALDTAGTDVGILIIGAGHTPHIKELLEAQGISYIVITPQGTRSLTSPEREREWFNRNLRGEKTPLEWWLSGIKPKIALAQPEKREAFALDQGIIESLLGKIEAEQLPGLAPNLVKNAEVRPLPDRHVELILQGKGPNARRLHITLQPIMLNNPVAREQLILHLKEIIGREDPQDGKRLGVRQVAAHIYDGGAFISYRPEKDEIFVEGLTYRGSPSWIAKVFKKTIDKPREKLKITEERVRERQPAGLFAPMPILEALMSRLDPILEKLGIPEDEVVTIPIRLGKGASPLREVDFNIPYTLMHITGTPGYERPLVFVNTALEPDVDEERPLGHTLEALRHSGPTERDIYVTTLPETETEFEKSPFKHRTTWNDFQERALRLQEDIKAMIGTGNVIEPKDQWKFFEDLQEKTRGITSATITLTFVAHQPKPEEKPVVFFKEKPASLRDVLKGLEWYQGKGRLPSRLNLEFILINCYGEEWVVPFTKGLGARAILRSPFRVDLPTQLRFYKYIIESKKAGKALYAAYQGALERLLKEVLEGEVEYLKLIYPVSEVPSSATTG